MATVTSAIPLPPPLRMTGSLANNWKTFKAMWNNYETAANLNDKATEVRTATFLACIGMDGFQLCESLDFAEEGDRTKIDKVLERLDRHFVGEINETFERFKFNQRSQEPNESIEAYVSALRALVKPCNFATLEESLLRDRIVIGIRDDGARRKLLQTRNLDLKTALDICRASEASSKQVKEMKPTEDVHKMQHASRKQQFKSDQGTTKPFRSKSKSKVRSGICKFCGSEHEFKKELCRAFGKTCNVCSGKNHIAKVCKKSRTDRVQCAEEEVLVLRSERESDFPKRLYAKLRLANATVQFQLDSGSSVNILPKSLFEATIGKESQLKPPPKMLLMYDSTELKTSGLVTSEVTNPVNNKTVTLDFYVVPKHKQPILGAAACQLFEFLTYNTENIAAIEQCAQPVFPLNRDSVMNAYHDVFNGDGKMQGKVHLEVDPSVTPVKLPLRKLPLAIKDKVKAELDNMVRKGIISPVDKPCDWISALLVVTKPNNQVRICIDPKILNRALKRNHYPLATLDDILPELQNAKVFSTVDTKNGFWQIELDEESKDLTCYETPFGIFRWNRLPFGLSVSPEEFQRRLNEALSGLQGIAIIADDILIYGKGQTAEEAKLDHDRNLVALLNRCREKGICLNPNKFKLHLKSVRYMGHLLTENGLKPDPQKIEAIDRMPPPTDVQGVQRINGVVNYLARFVPNLSERLEPLRALTRADNEFIWNPEVHGKAFEEVKKLLREAPVLQYFDSSKTTVVQSDASQNGIASTLLQDGRPVAYASRALTPTEKNYAHD